MICSDAFAYDFFTYVCEFTNLTFQIIVSLLMQVIEAFKKGGHEHLRIRCTGYWGANQHQGTNTSDPCYCYVEFS